MFDIFYHGPRKPLIFPELVQFASSLLDAKAKSRTKYFWYINGNCDYSAFDFTWFPHWSELEHTHIFPSQWQRNSGTMFVPKHGTEIIKNYSNDKRMVVTALPTVENWTIPETIDITSFDLSWHPDFDEPEPYIYHFPTKWQNTSGLTYSMPGAKGTKFASLLAKIGEPASIHFIQHYNAESESQLNLIKAKSKRVKVDRFVDNYFDTLKRVVANAQTEFIWVVNSICDYSNFDFTWTPDIWQQSMMHVFPTGAQKFGDTFYIHVPTFISQIKQIQKLEYFETIHYCQDQRVNRFASLNDVVAYCGDSVADAIKSHTFTKQYALFYPENTVPPEFNISLWLKTNRQVHVLAGNGSVVVAPGECKAEIQTQVYDYLHIMPHKELYVAGKPLDIVYISNGEPDAERWYNHLKSVAPSSQTIHWVKNVNGRSAAYKECAKVSTTPWYFNVFAKLEVNAEFDWNWQPDYMQQPKHYIFNALNPVNGLVYGHQAVIAYNKRLVLETDDSHGLDFTLSKEHEVVDMLSGTAHFNVSPIITWRTAFREAIKLKAATDAISAQRLDVWCTKATGLNAEWSLAGANDAVEYYDSVNGDMKELMKSFDWAWLNEYYANRNIPV